MYRLSLRYLKVRSRNTCFFLCVLRISKIQTPILSLESLHGVISEIQAKFKVCPWPSQVRFGSGSNHISLYLSSRRTQSINQSISALCEFSAKKKTRLVCSSNPSYEPIIRGIKIKCMWIEIPTFASSPVLQSFFSEKVGWSILASSRRKLCGYNDFCKLLWRFREIFSF